MLDTYRLIVSAAPESLAAAVEEVRFGQHQVYSTPLDDGVALLEFEQPLDELRQAMEQRPPVFIRHLMPVHRELALEGGAADLPRLERVAVTLSEHLPASAQFAIQTRLLGSKDWWLTRFAINEQLAAAVQAATGASLNVPDPHEVISVVLAGERAYLGISPVSFNRSAWAGGSHRFAREADQISRAEFKLLEAQAVVKFNWPRQGQALDLGAAPGGWTRILRRAGLPVVAVDPAALDPRIAADPGVRHLNILAQKFLEFIQPQDRFSVIVNDIRMDARDSARLMLVLAPALEPDGISVVTLKLPHDHTAKIAYHSLSILRSAYDVLGARQLFHNRSEVTVVLRGRRP